MMKRIVCVALIICMLCPWLCACGGDNGPSQMLSFSQAQSIEEMKKLNGKTVTIIGYMSTLSPVSGAFMYLMNLPYQSCPFCIPNTTQLSNTMAVYAKSKDGFEFTDRAIQVTGVMDFGDYTDEFGYQYNYRIKDATYSILDTTNMSEKLRLWQQLASTEAVADVYAMFDYIYFLWNWPTYTAQFAEGKDYLYPDNALYFIETEGAQFHYGFKAGYFDSIIAKIEAVDAEAFSDLVAVIRQAKTFADKAYTALKNGEYTPTKEYSDAFGDGRLQYKMNAADELESEWKNTYESFSNWLSGWEL